MTESEALAKIEEIIKILPYQHGGWIESISIQLRYCPDLLHDTVGPERVKEINMGIMAVREFDGFDEGSKEFALTESICAIDQFIKGRFFTYSEKVRHGMHKRS